MGVCCTKESDDASLARNSKHGTEKMKQAYMNQPVDKNPDIQEYWRGTTTLMMASVAETVQTDNQDDYVDEPKKDDEGESGATGQIEQPELQPVPVQKDEQEEEDLEEVQHFKKQQVQQDDGQPSVGEGNTGVSNVPAEQVE